MCNEQANQRRRVPTGPAVRNEWPLLRDSERGLKTVLPRSRPAKQSGVIAEFKLCRTITVMVNVSYLRNSSGRVEVIGFSQFEALRPVKWCGDFAENCPNVDIVNKLPVIMNIQFSRDFKEQTSDRNSHKKQGIIHQFSRDPDDGLESNSQKWQ
jgi:hypothetical protein